MLTVVATLLVLNFTSGEKKIEEKVDRQYALHDPQFQRALGVLLGLWCASRSSLGRYRGWEPLGVSRVVLDRAGHLLGIL